MSSAASELVLVQVVEMEGGREISWGTNLTEQLGERLGDVRSAIAAAARAVSDSLEGLRAAPGWQLGEVSASFGVTLTAEAGVVLSKASAGATFEVMVTYKHAE